MSRKGIVVKKLLAFAASNSSNSINQALLSYAVEKMGDHDVSFLDIRDYPLPIYGKDLEAGQGIPENAHKLKDAISSQDALIIASPEHNGSMPAVFKNIIDWLSRMVEPGQSFFGDSTKPVLLLSASPGPAGGATNLAHIERLMPYWGGDVKGNYSVGGFPESFQDGRLNSENDQELSAVIERFVSSFDH